MTLNPDQSYQSIWLILGYQSYQSSSRCSKKLSIKLRCSRLIGLIDSIYDDECPGIPQPEWLAYRYGTYDGFAGSSRPNLFD
jgi:hypothetical protein